MFKRVIFDSLSGNCIFNIREVVSQEIFQALKENKEIIILCVDNYKSNDNSLGSIVGDKLKFLVRDNVFIYGNLKNPIHDKTLTSINQLILKKHSNPFIILIDSSFGKLQDVGKVIIESKPLKPDLASCNIPSFINLSIKGIINTSSSPELKVLQNTSLYIVTKLAETISSGLYHAILKTVGGRGRMSSSINKGISL